MTKKYSREPENATRSCKASGSDLRVHFKNTCVSAAALKKMSLKRAKKYLENVLAKKEAIPFRFFNGCIGRSAQAKMTGATQCRWPTKSCQFLLHLLKNAESNAEVRLIAARIVQADLTGGASHQQETAGADSRGEGQQAAALRSGSRLSEAAACSGSPRSRLALMDMLAGPLRGRRNAAILAVQT